MAEERVPLEIRRAEPEDAAELLSIYAPYVEESWVTFECVPPTVEEFRRRMEEFSRHYPYLVCCRAGGDPGLCLRPPPHGAGGLPVERGAFGLSGPGVYVPGTGRAALPRSDGTAAASGRADGLRLRDPAQ